MRHFIRLTDIALPDLKEIFSMADGLHEWDSSLENKSVVLFFPQSSIRTRVAFEKGIALMGGQSVLFTSDALDKKEEIKDVIGYLNNWADLIIVRHNNLSLIEKMAENSNVPVINAMTNENHPCEILSDLYSLSKLREDFLHLQYTFVGRNGNIGKAWFEAAQAFSLRFRQCCPAGGGYEIANAVVTNNLSEAMTGSDIVLTDSLHPNALSDFLPYQITLGAMRKANEAALLNPCPPFYRGEEVSKDAVDSPHFVGYEFKKSLLAVQQALIKFTLSAS